MREEVENWWNHALRDLEAARKIQDIEEYYLVAFLCQQATEKALKALYIKKFNKLIKIHDIVFLSKKLELPEELINICEKLNPVYMESRYPDAGAVDEYTTDDTLEDLKNTKKVIEWIKNQL